MTTTTKPTSGTPLTHLHGHVYFADLHTDDVDGAAAFYRELFGWRAQEIPGAPMRYLPVEVDGRGRTALTGLTPEQLDAGTQPFWFPYLYVRDIDATWDAWRWSPTRPAPRSASGRICRRRRR